MWDKLFDKMIGQVIRKGTLTIEMPDGTLRTHGDGTGDPVRLHIKDPSLLWRIPLNPDIGVGEGYMDGTLTIENDDLYGLMRLGISNISAGNRSRWQGALDHTRRILRWLAQRNVIGRAQRNVAHHYDLSGKLYDLFLDPDKQYSCAYFHDPSDTLEAAQQQKKRHIAGKLLLQPGMRVLDIGCGWGGMALTLAREYDVNVLGVTLSEEQHKVATQRAKDAGLDGQVEFRLCDYRLVDDTFDRIVSVGMFEHVGVPHYREYFRHVREKLTEDGVALIHTIGRSSPPGTTSTWIAKYIFPGGYVPAMSEVMAAVEKEDLWATDVEVWRLHYAETLKNWHDRFMANRERVAELYDEAFVRMWRFYLVGAEMTFRLHHQCVFQFQLTRQQDAVPLTRDYLYSPPATEMSHAAE